jgi:hypothetical protein
MNLFQGILLDSESTGQDTAVGRNDRASKNVMELTDPFNNKK